MFYLGCRAGKDSFDEDLFNGTLLNRKRTHKFKTRMPGIFGAFGTMFALCTSPVPVKTLDGFEMTAFFHSFSGTRARTRDVWLHELA